MSKIFELLEAINDTTSKMKDELARMEEQKEEIITERDASDERIQEMEEEAIEKSSSNNWGLLGVQLDEAFAEIVSHQNTNQASFLQHLQSFTVNGFK